MEMMGEAHLENEWRTAKNNLHKEKGALYSGSTV